MREAGLRWPGTCGFDTDAYLDRGDQRPGPADSLWVGPGVRSRVVGWPSVADGGDSGGIGVEEFEPSRGGSCPLRGRSAGRLFVREAGLE